MQKNSEKLQDFAQYGVFFTVFITETFGEFVIGDDQLLYKGP